MKKNNRKGFTLVELLITIILLGVIGGIVIYNMSNISTKSKENDYESFIAKVKSAASVYADTYPEAFNELYISKAYLYITTGDIIDTGFLDADLLNPYTNERIGRDELIKTTLDTTTGAVTFTYPFKDDGLQESTLVAMSDYVVFGEPYDCMRGLGSYELSIADEDGNLIDLTATVNGVKNIDKYNFKCKMPDNFVDDSKNLSGSGSGSNLRTCGSQSCPGLSTTTPGNYEIEYTWITEDGVKKQATRVLRVLGKAVPTFTASASDYDFEATNSASDDKYKNNTNTNLTCKNCDAQNFYQTRLIDYTTNTWDVLTYKPYIDGADPENVTFRIRKRVNNPSVGSYVDVTGGFINNFNFSRQVDDGDKTYEITAKVTGHYYKNYSYQTTGYGRFKAELVIPIEYISAILADETWKTDNTFSIQNDSATKQSPVGIQQYEFRLSGATSLAKSLTAVSANMFNRNTAAVIPKGTEKALSVLNSDGTCSDKLVEYAYVFFRAKNKDGYIGTWTRYDARLTNSVSKIVASNPKCSTLTGNCNFTTKDVFVNVGGQSFNILSRYTDDTLVATTTGTTGVRVNPLSVQHIGIRREICDCVVVGSYNHYYANDEIMREARSWVNTRLAASAQAKLVTPAISGTSSVVTTYTQGLFNTYQGAAKGSEFWLLDHGTYDVQVVLNNENNPADEGHRTYETATNDFFYYVTSGGVVSSQYTGQTSFVKPIVRFKNLYICSGKGTSTEPFQAI